MIDEKCGDADRRIELDGRDACVLIALEWQNLLGELVRIFVELQRLVDEGGESQGDWFERFGHDAGRFLRQMQRFGQRITGRAGGEDEHETE